MPPSKRMSMEEKRKTILSIYHRTKDVYTEKEIATLATKQGVNSNTVVDVNTALVDDGLVDKAKIGGSNYFWSFPAKKDRQLQLEHLQRTTQSIPALRQALEEAETALADATRGREGTDRAERLAKLADFRAQVATLTQQLAALAENDPQALADFEKELKLCTQAAHRWTDNIFNCQSYLVKKRGMDKKQVDKMLGITSSFDYPEDVVPKK